MSNLWWWAAIVASFWAGAFAERWAGKPRPSRGRSQVTAEAARQWWLEHPEEAAKMGLPPDGRMP